MLSRYIRLLFSASSIAIVLWNYFCVVLICFRMHKTMSLSMSWFFRASNNRKKRIHTRRTRLPKCTHQYCFFIVRANTNSVSGTYTFTAECTGERMTECVRVRVCVWLLFSVAHRTVYVRCVLWIDVCFVSHPYMCSLCVCVYCCLPSFFSAFSFASLRYIRQEHEHHETYLTPCKCIHAQYTLTCTRWLAGCWMSE